MHRSFITSGHWLIASIEITYNQIYLMVYLTPLISGGVNVGTLLRSNAKLPLNEEHWQHTLFLPIVPEESIEKVYEWRSNYNEIKIKINQYLSFEVLIKNRKYLVKWPQHPIIKRNHLRLYEQICQGACLPQAPAHSVKEIPLCERAA